MNAGRRMVAVVALGVFVLAGCGGEPAPREEASQATGATPAGTTPAETTPADDSAQVEAVVEAYLTALADKDYATACDQFSEEGIEQMREGGLWGGSCEKTLQAMMSLATEADLQELRAMQVTSVEVEGDTAAAVVDDGAPGRLVRTDDGWKIAELPPPDGSSD